jgi:hypothetical protein
MLVHVDWYCTSSHHPRTDLISRVSGCHGVPECHGSTYCVLCELSIVIIDGHKALFYLGLIRGKRLLNDYKVIFLHFYINKCHKRISNLHLRWRNGQSRNIYCCSFSHSFTWFCKTIVPTHIYRITQMLCNLLHAGCCFHSPPSLSSHVFWCVKRGQSGLFICAVTPGHHVRVINIQQSEL